MIHMLATHPAGLFLLVIYTFVFLFCGFCMWRIVKVGGKKFDREFKDFFTSDGVKMLRKLES